VPKESEKTKQQLTEVRELILATNRTTHAVRAFVSFLFIQLAAITIALAVNFLGQVTQDTSECAYGICPPNDTATFIAGLIWIAGVVWSSNVGWKELGLSKVPSESASAPAKETGAQSDAASKAANSKNSPEREGSDTKKCSKCGYSTPKLDYSCLYCGSTEFLP
jgi:hypothetical protein